MQIRQLVEKAEGVMGDAFLARAVLHREREDLTKEVIQVDVKNILNGASKNPGVVTIKMICDGLGISLTEFFDTDVFRELEQEIR